MPPLSRKTSMDYLLVMVTIAGLLGVLQTFVIGRHFVIPTGILAATMLTGNLAWFGLAGQRWAKYLLFTIAVLIACHTFFALFWAKTPREMLGVWFLPVYAVVCVGFTLIAATYAQSNRLYRSA
ncbi:MAG: hypothetical protein KDI36_10880 [Pseudomonadales bacterium]|nr:hypothetical protein [Pseudomonadales bacterium]